MDKPLPFDAHRFSSQGAARRLRCLSTGSYRRVHLASREVRKAKAELKNTRVRQGADIRIPSFRSMPLLPLQRQIAYRMNALAHGMLDVSSYYN